MNKMIKATKEFQLQRELLEQKLITLESEYMNLTNKNPLEIDQEFIDYYYWDTDLKTTYLKGAIPNCTQLYTMVTKNKIDIFICSMCNNAIQYTRSSRSQETPSTCKTCEKSYREVSDASSRKYMIEREKALRLLKTMPYKEYLQTEHWKTFRKKFLRYANYKCQLCNKTDTEIHIHHRTYENRGCEQYKDVIALCSDCHKKFHDKLTSA